ncbi:glycosyltransferase family 39 protein [Halobium salinum]|uniref:Glycosyltransferase family 39 protein n=1 Tax=Halobium salinum TaxID=1364940 RepID=A0ABD5PEN8_9EURY|nr:glycosyltransferase family 39 protein [Halobium salinum]
MGGAGEETGDGSVDVLPARLRGAVPTRLRGATGARLLAAAVSLLAAVLVLWFATDLFAYRSVNDDEGVYLYQAAMLLEGRLFLHPPEAAASQLRPWFFVVDRAGDGLRMYPKYSPVAAGVFALGKAVTGSFAAALVAVAAGSTALVYAVSAAATDRRTGLVAALALVGSPLFLVSSSVFLSYAPTTFLNLAFAYGYVRAARADRLGAVPRRALGWGVLAGVAVGLAAFSRPFTALLFALPFVFHAVAVLARAWRTGGVDRLRTALPRYLAVGVPGTLFVGVTFAYNVVVTGDPFVFPYMAFGPQDGIGFGYHELLNYGVDYTPALAAETTVEVVEELLVDWFVAGTVGVALAAVGLAWVVVDAGRAWLSLARRRRKEDGRLPLPTASLAGMSDREVRVVVLALVPSVVLGEAYFWGTLNGLRNDLIELLGPYYHFDLLLPLSLFVAVGVVALTRGLFRAVHRLRDDPRQVRALVLVALLLAAPVVASAEAGVLAEPLTEHRERTENLETAYEPIERADFEHALVFTPDTYGDWQAHPFQHLRSDPGYDGEVVYATDGGPADDFAVLSAFGNRTPYRYTYRGEWAGATRAVNPELERLRVLRGERVRASTTFGVPTGATSASVRLETADGDAGSESGATYARYRVGDLSDRESLTVNWSVSPDRTRVRNLPFAAGSESLAPPPGASEVDLVVTFVGTGGSTVTYRQELTVERSEGSIRAVWPPETRVCRLTTECGREGTYVGPDGDYVSGVSVEASARATNESS